MKILVCDDIKERGEDTLNEIANSKVGHDIVGAFGQSLKNGIDALFERARRLLNRQLTLSRATLKGTVFEPSDFDIVVLDNNLAALEVSGARQTAESIAGYIRAFTNIPYIVSLNKNPEVDFDLRYLLGDYQTQADVALNTDHLANRALWRGLPGGRDNHFQPWYWPVLNEVPARRRKQVAFVKAHLNEPVLEALSFSTDQIEYLSRHAKGALSPEAEDTSIGTVTFREFFERSCRSLPIRQEREQLASKIDSESRTERNTTLNILARVVAAEIDRWIRRDILGPQDVLVDAPHLVMRMPFLLGKNVNRLKQWNKALLAQKRPFGLSEKIYRMHLARALFRSSLWTKSPCFWWQLLKADDRLNGMFVDDESNWVDATFCEDVSQFQALSSRAQDSEPREFTTEFEGTWNRRHVAVVEGRQYSPKSRFAV